MICVVYNGEGLEFLLEQIKELEKYQKDFPVFVKEMDLSKLFKEIMFLGETITTIRVIKYIQTFWNIAKKKQDRI